MITITNSPDIYTVMAKNQAVYKGNTDKYITIDGLKYAGQVGITALPVNGDTLTITYNGTNYVYTFKNTPDPDIYTDVQIEVTLAATNLNLLEAILSTFDIFNDFDISYNAPPIIVFAARNFGTQYQITFASTASYTTSGNTPINQEYEADFKIFWDIWYASYFPIPNDWKLLSKESIYPDLDQNFTHEISEIIRTILSPDMPTYNQASCSHDDKSVKLFQVKAAEVVNGLIKTYKNLGQRTILLAGFAVDKFPFVNWFATYLTFLNQKFLTNIPSGVLVSKTQHTFLYIASHTVDVVCDIYFDDGSSTLSHPLFTGVSNANKYMTIIPTGFTALNLAALEVSKSILHYDIFKITSGSASQKYRYYVDQIERRNSRYFLYHNSLNGCDTIYATGDIEKDQETDYITIEKFRNIDEAAFSEENDVVNGNMSLGSREQAPQFKVNIGYKSKAYVDVLAYELALSQKIYIHENGRYTEIIVPPGTIKGIPSDAEDTWSLEFEYYYAFTNKAF